MPRSPRRHTSPSSSIVNNRLVPNAMEPRAANAAYNKSDESYTLYVANQNPHVERLLMCAFVLGLPESKVRVIAPDVGGGFGSKIFLYPEDVALVWASKRVGRPIKWTAERSESFLTDAHGRDHVTTSELAMDAQGNFLALRVKTVANMGAYLSTFASAVPTILYATLLAGQYKTPAIYAEVQGGVHQHRAGRRLPRRRPARGHLRGRAHRRAGGARDEDRPGGAPPPELHHRASPTPRRSA